MYKLTKASAVKARTQTINQLKAVTVTADPALREELAGLGNAELFRTCAWFTDTSSQEEVGEESVVQATRITLGLLAHRIGQLSEEIREVDARMARLVEGHAPQLLEVVGIGPDTAVTLLITVGDNPERLDSEASSPRCAGSAASSVPRDAGSTVVSTAAATGRPTPRCIASCSPACGSTRAPRTTTSAASKRARPSAKSSDASSATRPARSSTCSDSYSQTPAHRGCRDR
jgi:transposase